MTNGLDAENETPPPAVPHPKWARLGATGFLLGALLSVILSRLGFIRGIEHPMLMCGLAAAVIGLTRLRFLLWIANAAAVIVFLVVSYTTLVPHLMRGLVRRDSPHDAPAVVVLGSFIYKDQTLSSTAQERILQGYTLLHQGFASRLVLTSTTPSAQSWEQVIPQQMRDLGLEFPIEVVGPVHNTHDEAVAVARLVQQRGWPRIILVTHSWHMRRAAAAFESAGVHVLCSPCPEGRYDFNALDTPGDRINGFRDWLHEAVGYWVYKSRGWIR